MPIRKLQKKKKCCEYGSQLTIIRLVWRSSLFMPEMQWEWKKSL